MVRAATHRVLQQAARNLVGELESRVVASDDLDAHALRARLDHCKRLRVHAVIYKELRPLGAKLAVDHRHRLP